MLEATGLETVSSTILDVRDHLHGLLENMGFEFLSPSCEEPLGSGIVTARHPRADAGSSPALEKERITASSRMARGGGAWLRFSPHFYNTRAEMGRIADVLRAALSDLRWNSFEEFFSFFASPDDSPVWSLGKGFEKGEEWT